MKSYRFLNEAEAEFHEYIRYYDEQVAGLGDRFIADVQHVIDQIRRYPESGRLLSRTFRKRVLRVFKFNIFYVDTAAEIVVIAIAPHKRKPGYWRKRLENIK